MRTSRPARPAAPRPAERRRQWTLRVALGCLALLTAAVTDAVTGVVTNGMRGGWERVTGGESLVLNVAVLPGGVCGSEWLLPVGTGPAPREHRAVAGRPHPALVLLASDLALLAVFTLPAVTRRVRANRWVGPGDGSVLVLPDLSFASLDPPTTLAALAYDDWRPGVVVRELVFLALHTLLAVQVARRAAPGRALADVRVAVLAASPLVGGLAGLTLVVPSALGSTRSSRIAKWCARSPSTRSATGRPGVWSPGSARRWP